MKNYLSPPARDNKLKIELKKIDCLEYLQTLADNSIDLIVTDPPFYKIKKDDWDNQWTNKQAYLFWLENVLQHSARVLKPTGNFYIFASPKKAAKIELLTAKYFKVQNNIVWIKQNGTFRRQQVSSCRKFFTANERIIFATSNKPREFAYKPVLDYMRAATTAAGLAAKDINKITNTYMATHWLSKSQFTIPNAAHYELLQQYCPQLTKTYAELKTEYLKCRNSRQRRYFNLQKGDQFIDWWDFKNVEHYPNKHPCEKPQDLLKHIIKSSSRAGDTVLDVFAGSASTAIACHALGRNFKGCEFGENEHAQAVKNIITRTTIPAENLII